jgi:hypothetical protein
MQRGFCTDKSGTSLLRIGPKSVRYRRNVTQALDLCLDIFDWYFYHTSVRKCIIYNRRNRWLSYFLFYFLLQTQLLLKSNLVHSPKPDVQAAHHVDSSKPEGRTSHVDSSKPDVRPNHVNSLKPEIKTHHVVSSKPEVRPTTIPQTVFNPLSEIICQVGIYLFFT